MSDYEIRFVEPGDRNAYLDLYQAVLDQPKSAEWFEWKYERNPYVDHVPIVIARAGDEIVGARSFFALEMRVDGDPRVVLEPCDTIVRTDYRRRGLFTRMTELAIDRYEGRYALFFNFPNRDTLSGNLDLGWKVVSDRPHYYRIESPAALVAERDGPATLRLAASTATPFVRAYYRLRDRRSSTTPRTAIETTEGVPADVLANLYRQSIPEEIHAVRDRRFYDWRFDNPEWTYHTTVASRDDEHRAAVVTGTAVSPETGRTVTKLTDVVPLQGAPPNVLDAVLQQVLAENPETDIFTAPPQGIPDAVLGRAGFHADGRLPLSLVSSATTHVVRSLSADRTSTDRADPDDWLLTFAERDMS